MKGNDLERQLKAILSADAVGYSSLMAKDEVATVRTLTAFRNEMSDLVNQHKGRVVDFVGDNMLAEFQSTIDAVDGALEIQEALKHANARLSPEHRMYFRIGIHLGDVMIDGERIYGDGVNVAARLEGLAEPGEVCVSDMIFRQVQHKIRVEHIDLGEVSVKNIPDPIRAYRLKTTSADLEGKIESVVDDKNTEPSLPKQPSLAVLPFVNLSADPEQEYFSTGLTMDIITALIKIHGLFLISDSSVFAYKDKPMDLQELGKQLGVHYILDGGVRKAGDRVRVTAQLTDSSSGRLVWAEHFDRKIDDLFAIQDEITEKIVTALDIKLVSGEWGRILRKTLRNPEALECYYRGWEALFGSSREDLLEAQQMFEETILLESESPLGYALAAWAYWMAAYRGLSDNIPLSLERSSEYAHEALKRDDVTGLPHLVLAQIHLLEKDHDLALAEVEKAVLSRPSCDGSFAAKAQILNFLGKPDEAIDLVKHAIHLSPVYPSFFPAILASAFYNSGKYDEAASAAEEALQLDKDNLEALLVLTAAKVALGSLNEADLSANEVMRVEPGFSLDSYAESQPYKDPGATEKITEMLKKAGLN
ncbi:adenylate/guanylate cyclase domain-containing protein [bacterium]|nr:MAG: adenylate/guanylate cyclase domain-containing protein [bacterium]